MARCVCSEAEVECKCGCGCICVDDDTIEIQDRCLTMCFKCPDPVGGSVAGIRDLSLGLDTVVGRLSRRRKLNKSTRLRVRFNQAPLGTVARVLEKLTGARLAVPSSRLGAKQSMAFEGTLDQVARKLGLVMVSK